MFKRKKIDKRKKAFLKALIKKLVLVTLLFFIAFIVVSASLFLSSLLGLLYS